MEKQCQQKTQKLGNRCKHNATKSFGVQFVPDKEVKIVALCNLHSKMFVKGKLILYK